MHSGVRDDEGSILRHGDLSVLSFHATKVFNTFEGGAIVCHDPKTKQHIDHLKNFGFVDETTVVAPGINAKMSEMNAAFGLLQLKHMPEILRRRAAIDSLYREAFDGVRGIRCLPQAGQYVANYAYFPILIEHEYPMSRDELYRSMKDQHIYTRRYFYPLIADFPMYRGLPSAERSNIATAAAAADKVLCLPIYPALSDADAQRVAAIVINGSGVT